MEIGGRIKAERKRSGLTLEQLGNMIGVSKQTVSKYENGKLELSLEMTEKLSAALGVPVVTLLGFKLENAQPATEEELLLRRFRRLDAYNKKLVLDLARQLGPENPLQR